MNQGAFGLPLGLLLPSGLAKLEERLVGGSVSQIDLVMPNEVAHLLLVAQLRSDQASSESNALMRLNDDSGSNYRRQSGGSQGSTALASVNTSATSALLGNVAGGGTGGANPADNYGFIVVVLPFFKSNRWKGVLSWSWDYDADPGPPHDFGTVEQIYGLWRSRDSVNKVSIIPGGGNWVADSALTVYGLV